MPIMFPNLHAHIRNYEANHPLENREFPSAPALAALLSDRATDYANEMRVMSVLYYYGENKISLDYLKEQTELNDEDCSRALIELDKDNWIRLQLDNDTIAINHYKIFAYCRK